MNFYAMGFDELLRTPLKRFWFLLAQIDRIKAEDDLRMVHVIASANTAEAYDAASQHFSKQLGEVFVFEKVIAPKIDAVTGLDPEFDRAGLHALKATLQAEKMG